MANHTTKINVSYSLYQVIQYYIEITKKFITNWIDERRIREMGRKNEC